MWVKVALKESEIIYLLNNFLKLKKEHKLL